MTLFAFHGPGVSLTFVTPGESQPWLTVQSTSAGNPASLDLPALTFNIEHLQIKGLRRSSRNATVRELKKTFVMSEACPAWLIDTSGTASWQQILVQILTPS